MEVAIELLISAKDLIDPHKEQPSEWPVSVPASESVWTGQPPDLF